MSRTQRTRTERDVANEREENARQLLQLDQEFVNSQKQQTKENREDKNDRSEKVENKENKKLNDALKWIQKTFDKSLNTVSKNATDICETNREGIRYRQAISASQPDQAALPAANNNPQRLPNSDPNNNQVIGVTVIVCFVFLLLILLFKK